MIRKRLAQGKEVSLSKTKRIPFAAVGVILFVIYLLLTSKNLILFLAILAVSAYVNYICYKRAIKFSLGHIFFIGMLVGWLVGVTSEVLFILIAGLVSEVMSGYIDLKTFLSYPIMIGVVSAFVIYQPTNIGRAGMVASIVYYVIMFFVSKFTAEPPHETFLEVVMPFLLNLVYFLNFSGIAYALLGMVLK